jgi:FkbM family methyltransferase
MIFHAHRAHTSAFEASMKPAKLGLCEIEEIPDILRILDHVPPVAKPCRMVQIGASEGNLARKFARFGWEAYGFDANPRYAEALASNRTSRRLHLYNKAIAAESADDVTFFVSAEHSGIGSLKQFHETHRPICVPAITLADFYAERGIDAIDFFMIDAEQMDLPIMASHDWGIPIAALLMECGVGNGRMIYDAIMQRNSCFDHVVYVHKKRFARYGEQASCVGKLRIDDFVELPREQGYFGNILFHSPVRRNRGFDSLRPTLSWVSRKARSKVAGWLAG